MTDYFFERLDDKWKRNEMTVMRMTESRERECLGWEDLNIFKLREKGFSGKRGAEIARDKQ